jgi:16S rRNA (adenine1518-N6/adenine1519-N6)-dimethyltransferase
MSKQAGHQARKRFGQNFLQDQNIIRNILLSISPKQTDNIVEIGPGLGAITEHLLKATEGNLNVVEIDRDLVKVLTTQFFNFPNMNIHQGDALKFDFSQLGDENKKLRIVGNLPYNISTPLIFHLISFAGQVKDMHFMLQKEVVDRMAAQAGDSAYGRLSVMVQYFCRVESLFNVPPTAFHPQPKVDSAIVRLVPYDTLPTPAKDPKHLAGLVTTAFNQRRKTIRNNLKKLMSAEQLEALGINPGLRPENLTLQNFVDISDTLSSPSSDSDTDQNDNLHSK